MQKEIKTTLGVTILAIFTLLFIVFSLISLKFYPSLSPFTYQFSRKTQRGVLTLKTFSSPEDFKNYLAKTGEVERGIETLRFLEVAPRFFLPAPEISLAPPLTAEKVPTRVSETNVQVPGIDEPDILKTDGKEIYFSPGKAWPIWREPIFAEPELKIIPPYYKEPKTKLIRAFPVEKLALDSEIEKSGDLLLMRNILVIFSREQILGYDVSDPKNPQKKWEIKLESKSSILTSRLYNNKIYLVLANNIKREHPCPIKPLILEGKEIEIKCQEIYYPDLPYPPTVDVTFLAMILDPLTGKIEKRVSFVGSLSNSVVYMSKNSLYITYFYTQSLTEFFLKFLKEKCKDLFPNEVIQKIERVTKYDLHEQTKSLELEIILRNYMNSLDDDERMRVENEIENRFSDFYDKEKREFEKTGIVKIDLKEFEIKSHGNVPGFPLNQFALDEYEGNLRIAVTVGERFFARVFGIWERKSANDVYVLDKDLKIIGKIEDLGLTERIYSVRFIEDKGYLVTFRQTDPFYVLDLSDPKNPKLKGELKIPGYSSYLHEITKDKILGIGKEGWKVKISLFDVSDPNNPKEIDKYLLEETWSEILSTHHAFLLDRDHEIFFLPGSKGGYIFSYKNNRLGLVKAVSQASVKRAIYIEDYLYIVSDNKIVVLNELNWEKVKELEI